MLTASAGFAIAALIAVAAIGWIGTRHILLSPESSTPLSAAVDGWRSVRALFKASRRFALIVFTVKLAQILGHSTAGLIWSRRQPAWLISGTVIDLAFTLAWAAVALRIDLFILEPDLARPAARPRIRRAIVYAAVFWGLMVLLKIGGVLLYAALKANGRIVVAFAVNYLPLIFIVAAALTRPAIAIALPKPFRETLRILHENWFGIAVTLGLAALPLGFVFFAVGLLRQLFHMPVFLAILLEIPIAAASALCYAAFEGGIAQMYRRIM